MEIIECQLMRLWRLARAGLVLVAVYECCWVQRDDTPVWPRND